MSACDSSKDGAGVGERGGGAGWTREELERNPHRHADKADKVRGMFGAIAERYDLNNRLHSLGLDQRWRRAAVRLAGLSGGERVLDVACGTGDLSEAFARAGAGEVVGADFTPAMLEVARRKRGRLPAGVAEKLRYEEQDAMALPYPDASFDVVSIAFGIRNVSDPAAALGQFRRVLRAGGRLVVLEFDQPRSRLLSWFNGVYCEKLMPRTATLISGDRSGAYHYLPKSVSTYQSREAFVGLLRDAGFERVTSRALSLGICVCYRGEAGEFSDPARA